MPQITVKAVIDSIPEVMDFVDQLLKEKHCGIKAQTQLMIAIDELFSNIAYYAYPNGEGDATVCVDFDEAKRMLALTFIDRGVPYDPLKKEDPDITLSAEEREIGGLGILMVRKTMDDVVYHYLDGQNILTIYKKI